MINSLEKLFREQQGERRAFSGRALHLYPAAVGFGDLARYREPQADSVRRAGRVRTMETLEYGRQLVLRDPDARIRDLHLGPALFLPDPHRHLATVRGVLDGVVQEYGGHLPDAVLVEGGVDRPFRGEVLDGHLLVRGGTGCPRRFFGDGREVVVCDLQGRALVAAGQRQETLYQPLHALRFPPDGLHALPRGVRVPQT